MKSINCLNAPIKNSTWAGHRCCIPSRSMECLICFFVGRRDFNITAISEPPGIYFESTSATDFEGIGPYIGELNGPRWHSPGEYYIIKVSFKGYYVHKSPYFYPFKGAVFEHWWKVYDQSLITKKVRMNCSAAIYWTTAFHLLAALGYAAIGQFRTRRQRTCWEGAG